MHYIVLVSLLAACVLADEDQHYSFNPAVGSGTGTPYSLTGEGRITAVRVWDDGSYIYGVQFRYGDIWSEKVGSSSGSLQEILLNEDEAIVQISGKYGYYYYYWYYVYNIQSLVFVTSKGRSLFAGQPGGSSFNMYPEHPKAELRFISGNQNGLLTSISAHWAVVPENTEESG